MRKKLRTNVLRGWERAHQEAGACGFLGFTTLIVLLAYIPTMSTVPTNVVGLLVATAGLLTAALAGLIAPVTWGPRGSKPGEALQVLMATFYIGVPSILAIRFGVLWGVDMGLAGRLAEIVWIVTVMSVGRRLFRWEYADR